MSAKPIDHSKRSWFRGLPQDVGVHQILHRVSVDRREEALVRTSEKPIHNTFVGTGGAPNEPINSRLEAFDLKLLPGLNTVQVP
jgi:hypothetical protein